MGPAPRQRRPAGRAASAGSLRAVLRFEAMRTPLRSDSWGVHMLRLDSIEGGDTLNALNHSVQVPRAETPTESVPKGNQRREAIGPIARARLSPSRF